MQMTLVPARKAPAICSAWLSAAASFCALHSASLTAAAGADPCTSELLAAHRMHGKIRHKLQAQTVPICPVVRAHCQVPGLQASGRSVMAHLCSKSGHCLLGLGACLSGGTARLYSLRAHQHCQLASLQRRHDIPPCPVRVLPATCRTHRSLQTQCNQCARVRSERTTYHPSGRIIAHAPIAPLRKTCQHAP